MRAALTVAPKQTSVGQRAYAIANALHAAAGLFQQYVENDSLPQRTRDQFWLQAEEAETIAGALENSEDILIIGTDSAEILRDLGAVRP